MGRKRQDAFAMRVSGIAAAGEQPVGWVQKELPSSRDILRGLHDVDDQARAMRLRAKTINFSCTIVARCILLAGSAVWLWSDLESSGTFSRGRAMAILVQLGDLGRVIDKLFTPGTK